MPQYGQQRRCYACLALVLTKLHHMYYIFWRIRLAYVDISNNNNNNNNNNHDNVYGAVIMT